MQLELRVSTGSRDPQDFYVHLSALACFFAVRDEFCCSRCGRSKGVSVADLGVAACARTDLFSAEQIQEISRLVSRCRRDPTERRLSAHSTDVD